MSKINHPNVTDAIVTVSGLTIIGFGMFTVRVGFDVVNHGARRITRRLIAMKG